ncbi:MAG: hypothetical protein A2293_02630 [Elusimicrobia bacterium RIFOXYB2_FULL_49_7]|nr:MAG: hypothetical protein A2293_02630 [Elusimicrobia bacterium RIFOXYB2_FULL_49_7]
MLKVKYLTGSEIDPVRSFRAVLIVDDEKTVCEYLGKLISDHFSNILVVCCSSPERAIRLTEMLYFDVVMCDVQMDILRGDQLINALRKKASATFYICMTGKGPQSSFYAGLAQPDDFIYKDILEEETISYSVQKGLDESLIRRCRISLGYYDVTQDTFMLKSLNWRIREKIRNAIGFTSRFYDVSRKKTKALALCVQKNLPETEIARIAGYESPQKMNSSLQDLLLYT